MDGRQRIGDFRPGTGELRTFDINRAAMTRTSGIVRNFGLGAQEEDATSPRIVNLNRNNSRVIATGFRLYSG